MSCINNNKQCEARGNILLTILMMSFFFMSCVNETNTLQVQSKSYAQIEPITLRNGYLQLRDRQAFIELIEGLKEGSALSRSVVSLPGFKSIHDMNLELDAKLTSRVIDNQGLETGCVDDYNLAKAEMLLKDERRLPLYWIRHCVLVLLIHCI